MWEVTGHLGPDKAQTRVSQPAARGENSVLHPPEVRPTQEVSPAFWPNLYNNAKPQARPLYHTSMYERGEAANTGVNIHIFLWKDM